MERDLDKKLYNDYLNGEKQSFEYLYNRYKSKVQYFILNIDKGGVLYGSYQDWKIDCISSQKEKSYTSTIRRAFKSKW